MADASFDERRRLLERRDDLSATEDPELERIRDRLKADFIRILRAGIDQINRLPDEGRPGQEARRRAEIEWFGVLLETMDAPQ